MCSGYYSTCTRDVLLIRLEPEGKSFVLAAYPDNPAMSSLEVVGLFEIESELCLYLQLLTMKLGRAKTHLSVLVQSCD